jgi:hypothetical protein
LLLFALIFLWTPPHFWALSLFVRSDYAAAGVPMLPVVAGARGRPASRSCSTHCRWWRQAIAPWPLHLAGPLYGIAAAGLSFAFLASRPARPRQQGDRAGRHETRKAALQILDPLSVRHFRRARPGSHAVMSDDEIRRRQRGRAIIMAVLLGLFVVLVYAITIAKMGLYSS